MFGIPLVAGRKFEAGRQDDAGYTYILNESAVSLLGYESAPDALGESQTWVAAKRTGTVVGVCEDFHTNGLQHKLEPLFIVNNRYYYWALATRVRAQDPKKLFGDMEAFQILPT